MQYASHFVCEIWDDDVAVSARNWLSFALRSSAKWFCHSDATSWKVFLMGLRSKGNLERATVENNPCAVLLGVVFHCSWPNSGSCIRVTSAMVVHPLSNFFGIPITTQDRGHCAAMLQCWRCVVLNHTSTQFWARIGLQDR